jgi:hypothetical protein
MYKNYKLDVLETKIDKLEQNNKDVLPQKVEKPKLDPYVGMDAFTRNFYDTMYPKLK